MTKKELVDYCLSFPSTYLDYPFGKDAPVLKHRGNNKIFGLLLYRQEKLCLNLKCDPIEADFLRRIFEGVIPGYHMNKTHWNTVYINSDVDKDNLHQMIKNSYDLTKPKRKGTTNTL